MQNLIHDLKYGFRLLTKKPGFTIVSVLALALGIGANTAIFSVVNTVLLRPLPFEDPDRLVMVWESRESIGYPKDTPTPANFIDWRTQNQVFEDMAAIATKTFNLTGAGEPEKVEALRVSASFFPLLGVEPQHGRWFGAEEDHPGSERVVILSHGLWQRRFGGDPNIVNQPISLDDQSYLIVGVMPQRFYSPSWTGDLWVPIAFSDQEAARRSSHYLRVIARIKPDVSFEQAQTNMAAIAARLQEQYPQTNMSLGAIISTFSDEYIGDIKTPLLILFAAVGLVLLIACANVANLLLARAAARQKEVAIRTALGAGRSRLIRQFLTESLLLAAIGGAMGLLFAALGLKALVSLIPANISQAKDVTIDAGVLGFTLLASLLTGVIFGLVPALQASRPDLNDALKEGGKGPSGAARSRIRNSLVVAEVALALVLLVGAGLLINSFIRLRSVDVGFKADNLLTMSVAPPPSRYPNAQSRTPFYNSIIERVATIPGVQSVAFVSRLPLTYNGDSLGIYIEGKPEPPPDQLAVAITRVVSSDYFKTMGIPLIDGRELTDSAPDTMPVIVVSEAMARTFWPGESALGKRIKLGPLNSEAPWLTVVGVVGNVRQFELQKESGPQMYIHYRQAGFFAPRDLVIRTTADPLSLAAAVRDAVWSVDKDQAVANISTMENAVSEAAAKQRFNMLLLGIFAGIAMLLAAVGIYGVMSFSVTQRTHEIGIRMALGASSASVLRMMIWQALKLVAIGMAIGLVAAFALTSVMESMLFGVRATDAQTFAVISIVLAAVAMLASYVPARRATKVDPMIALRYE